MPSRYNIGSNDVGSSFISNLDVFANGRMNADVGIGFDLYKRVLKFHRFLKSGVSRSGEYKSVFSAVFRHLYLRVSRWKHSFITGEILAKVPDQPLSIKPSPWFSGFMVLLAVENVVAFFDRSVALRT
jgi:hypothetical protein